jgi:hypothetical protein
MSFVVVEPFVIGVELVMAGFSVSVEVGRCVLAGEVVGFCVLGGVAGFHIIFSPGERDQMRSCFEYCLAHTLAG